MDYLTQTREELVKELQEVRKELDLLKASGGREITGSNSEEEPLTVSGENFRLIFDYNPVAMALIAPDKTISMVNEKYCMSSGYTRKEVVGRSWTKIIPPEDLGRMKEYNRRRKINPKDAPDQYEFTFYRKNGEIWHSMISITMLSNQKIIASFIDITERKQVQEDLQRSELRYHNLFDQANEGLILLSKDGKLVEVNKSFAEMHGYTVEEMKNLDIRDLDVLREGVFENRAELIQRIDAGEVVRFEVDHYHKNGHIITFSSSASLINIGDQQYYLAFHQDITESKRIVESLKETASSLNEAQEIAMMGSWELDLVNQKAKWSENCFILYGLNPFEIEPTLEYFKSRVHPDDLPIIDETFENTFKFRNKSKAEVRIRFPNGNDKWAQINIAPVFLKDELVAVKGIQIDITDRKLAEDKIRQKDSQFRKLSSNLPDLIFQFTRRPDGTYCVPIASEGIKNIFGCSPEDVLEDFAPIGRVIFHEDAERVINDIEYSAKHLTYFTCEFRVQIPGKPIQWIFSRSTPEKLADGSITWYGFNADITEMKQKEEEVLDLNRNLDMRVKQRTSELEAASKELETFSYSVSHDLKTPLRHIRSFIGLFLENKSKDLSEEDLKYLDIISSSASDMEKLIDGILSFSKLNGIELQKTKIRSSEMVQQVITFFDPEIQNRKITIHIETLPEVKGDEGLIRQVWINLISNAIKYTMKKPETVIEIGSSSTDNEITFFIKDNGAGFNVKYAEKLFGVFQRLHKSSDFDGVGIGLANVNRIITRHGGYCRAEGEVDKGATFYFSLPK